MKMIQSGDIRIATEAFGTPTDPVLVLVMGATASMLGWPEALCRQLAENGRFVIRYDQRDTGQSTTGRPGEVDYAVEDMAADLLAVLDGYGLGQAHLVGMSLGGFIAQMLALEHAERVETLTLIATEPLGWDSVPLPHIAPEFLDHFAGFATLDWTDKVAVETFLLGIGRLGAGSAHGFDEEGERETIQAMLARTASPASMFNHSALTTREDWTGSFRDILQPVLVIHGSEDPVLPLPNGEAIAAGVKHGRIVVLEGVGHELPEAEWPVIVGEIVGHTE